jgi:hypothetical protein
MWKTVDMKDRLRMTVMLLTSVSLLGPLAPLTPARADPRTALCTVQIAADGPVLGTLSTPSGFHLTVSVPDAGEVTVPLPCESRDTAVLALTNQAHNRAVTAKIETFTAQGQLSCTKAPLVVPSDRGSMMTFAECH